MDQTNMEHEVNRNTVVNQVNGIKKSFQDSSIINTPPSSVRPSWVNFEPENNGNTTQSETESVLSSDSPSSFSAVATIEPSQSLHVVSDPLSEQLSRSPRFSPLSASSSAHTRHNSNINTIDIIDDKVVIDMSESKEANQLQTIALNAEPKLERPRSLTRPNSAVKPFSNGDIIVSMLPLNSSCAWVTPAAFKPELVPEELMANSLALTVEDYVSAMQRLVNDYRFTMYLILYKRVLFVWIALGFILLLSLLFSGVRGLPLFAGGLVWLIMNALGIFVCMWFKFKLYHLLEKCMAVVNEHFYKSNIILGIDDQGHLSCHKVNLVFVYFDVSQCVNHLNDLITDLAAGGDNRQGSQIDRTLPPLDFNRMDIDNEDIVITGGEGAPPKTVSRKDKTGEKLLLRYSQRWVKEFARKRIDLGMALHHDGTSNVPPTLPPRHCAIARCPCQYIEEHLRFKPLTKCSLSDLFL